MTKEELIEGQYYSGEIEYYPKRIIVLWSKLNKKHFIDTEGIYKYKSGCTATSINWRYATSQEREALDSAMNITFEYSFI